MGESNSMIEASLFSAAKAICAFNKRGVLQMNVEDLRVRMGWDKYHCDRMIERMVDKGWIKKPIKGILVIDKFEA